MRGSRGAARALVRGVIRVGVGVGVGPRLGVIVRAVTLFEVACGDNEDVLKARQSIPGARTYDHVSTRIQLAR